MKLKLSYLAAFLALVLPLFAQQSNQNNFGGNSGPQVGVFTNLNGAVFAGAGNTVQQTLTTAGVNGLSFVYPNYVGVDIPNGTRVSNITNPTLSAQPNGAHLQDYRYGEYVDFMNNPAFDALSNIWSAREEITVWNQSLGNTSNGGANNAFGHLFQFNILSGTQNINQNSYTNKSNLETLNLTQNNWSSAQAIPFATTCNAYGTGDCLAASFVAHSWGGSDAGSDEGIEALDVDVSPGNIEPLGTISAGGTTGSTSLTLNFSQGSGKQGVGNFVIDNTQVYTTGTITSIAGSGAAVAVTGSATAWTTGPLPVAASTTTTTSAAITVTGTNLTPGSVNIQVASSTGFVNGSKICVADAGTFEYAAVTAAPDGTHITATFALPHATGATISTGGLCGYGFEVVADRYILSGAKGFVTVTPPLHQIWPVISNSSATSMTIWVSVGGGAATYAGNGTFPGQTYALYPMGQITSVINGGATVSSTITLAPNNVAWAASDSLYVVPFPTRKVGLGNWQINQWFASQATSTGGSGPTYNGVWSGNQILWNVTNNTPLTMYNGHGGKLTAPYGYRLQGYSQFGMLFDILPNSVGITFGCPVNSSGVVDCTITNVFTQNIIGAQSNIGTDYIMHSAGNAQWAFLSNGSTDALYIPLINGSTVAGSADIPVEVGYVSCTQANCASSATTLYTTPAADSLYRADLSVACSTSTATATGLITITYTDVSGTAQTFISTTATCTTLGAASVGTATVTFSAKASTAIQYSVTQANAPAGLRARVAIFQESTN